MYKRFILVFLAALGLNSCEQSGDFTPGPGADIFDVAVLDTFRLETSTILIDSILTSQVDRLLVGSISDPDLGDFTASTYFKMGPSANLTFSGRSFIYDSLYLMLRYDGYSFGDERQEQKITVREVLEEYGVATDEVYFDYDRLNYSRQPLGDFSFDPEWEEGDSIAVKISDELGQRLFALAEEGKVRFSDEDFEREFEGLALVPELGSTGHIMGFSNSTNETGIDQTTNITLRMYYHEEGEFTENYEFDFLQVLPTLAFNAYEPDRDKGLLAALTDENPIMAEEADNKTFIQAASGIQTKIRFPTVDALNKLDPQYIVSAAILRLEPVPGSYGDLAQLPDSLALYLTDKYDQVGNVTFSVSSSTQLAQYGRLQADDERGLFAYYEFEVSEFIFQQLSDQNQNELALLAAPTAQSILGGVDQLQLGGQDYPVRGINLQIYLTKIID